MTSATLIGDVIASRHAPDRAQLHAEVGAVLAEVDRLHPGLEPLRITVGDEYQGRYGDLATALRASLALVAATGGRYAVRHGLGWGPVATLQTDPPVQDGPGWWAARTAIEAVAEAQRRPATRWRRTAFRNGADNADSTWWNRAVEASLVMRDRLLADVDGRGLSVLHGMLRGETQREIGARLGISASAVSQRIRSDGLDALLIADQTWKDPA